MNGATITSKPTSVQLEKNRAANRIWYDRNREAQCERGRQYYANNKESRKEYGRIYRAENLDKCRKAMSKWQKKNIERVLKYNREYSKRKYQTNPNFVLAITLRRRLRDVLIGRRKILSAIKMLGCSVESFRIYLESKFEPGMTWENYGNKGWHVDHIIPCALFDLTNLGHQKACFHFSNMQPMWAVDNIKKGVRIL